MSEPVNVSDERLAELIREININFINGDDDSWDYDERAALQELQQRRAQLAAEASAVEVLGRLNEWIRKDDEAESTLSPLPEGESLEEFVRRIPPSPFKPIPWFCRDSDAIEWYWESDNDYSKPVMHDGQWIGSLYIGREPERVIGVRLHIDGEIRERIQRHYVKKALAALVAQGEVRG